MISRWTGRARSGYFASQTLTRQNCFRRFAAMPHYIKDSDDESEADEPTSAAQTSNGPRFVDLCSTTPIAPNTRARGTSSTGLFVHVLFNSILIM